MDMADIRMRKFNRTPPETVMAYVEEQVRRSLENEAFDAERPVPPASSRYLDLAERIVVQAAEWQDGSGRIIDPYVGKETSTVTARFAGALGLLLLQGRCLNLAGACAKALTPALEDLFEKRTDWGEFIAKEACVAYMAVKGAAPEGLASRWRHLLADYDPEKSYSRTFANNPDGLQNFCTFAIAGEAFKRKLGLADNLGFMDRYVEQQLGLFDVNGMYNDPGSPMTYDIVSRMNLSLAIWAGYDGKHLAALDETLEKGALSQLLCQSPSGECPFGGRSNQQNFNEATFALICEYEAARWKRKGDLQMAGAFKQAAAMAICSIEECLRQNPVRFTKNMFPSETRHGGEKGYGFYGAYTLLIAGQLGFASLLADKGIEPQKCPAQCGGYVFRLEPGFHKIFANCRGTHLEIDSDADFHYDATGLGRVHFRSCHPALVLSTPITASPSYLTSIPCSRENVAIGPGWSGAWLAAMNDGALSSTCDVLAEGRECVSFEMNYVCEAGSVSERYSISRDEVEIVAVQKEGRPLAFRIPLLATDGDGKSEISVLENGFKVAFKGAVCHVECSGSGVEAKLEDFDAPNRNGIYKIGRFASSGSEMRVRISVS